MENKRTNSLKYIIFSILTIILLSFRKMYDLTNLVGGEIDNYSFSLVANKILSDDSFFTFSHPIFHYFTDILLKIFPNSDVFKLACIIFGCIGIFCLFYEVNKITKDKNSKTLSFIFLFLIIVQIDFFNANYMILSGVYFGISIIFLYEALNKTNKELIISLIFLLFSASLRTKVTLLCSPFLFLFLVYYIISEKIVNRKINKDKIIKILIYLFCFVLLILSYYIVIYNKENIDATIFNDCRTVINDYSIDVTGNEEIINEILSKNGLSVNDYAIVKNWMMFDNKFFTSDTLRKMNSSKLYNITSLKTFLTKTFFYLVIYSAISVCYLLYSIKALKNNTKIKKIFIIFSILGKICLDLFFTIKGRYINRLFYVTMICSFITILLINNLKIEFKNTLNFIVILMTLFVSTFIMNFYDINSNYKNNVFNAKVNQEEYLKLEQIEDKKIFCDNESIQYFYKILIENNKIPSKEMLKNRIIMGELFYNQNYYNDYLKDNGVDNFADEILSENAMVMTNEERIGMITTYFKEHYGKDVVFEKEGVAIENVKQPIYLWKINEKSIY